MSTRLERPVLSKNDENDSIVTRKHSGGENPVGKGFDTSKSTGKPKRSALGDLSNTKRAPLFKQQSSKPANKPSISVNKTTTITEATSDEEYPDIEYMPPPDVDEEPKFKAPDYFKGVLMEAMKTNPFKIAAKASVKKPVSTDISDLPDLFYQMDFGTDSIDLPDIDDLNF